MTNEQRMQIASMRKKGVKYGEIAKELNLSPNTVKSFCYRNNLNDEYLKNSNGFCKNCGKPIKEKSKTRPRIFCSMQCKRTWWNAHRNERESTRITDCKCVLCNKSFTDYESAHRKYCSTDCYRKRGSINA